LTSKQDILSRRRAAPQLSKVSKKASIFKPQTITNAHHAEGLVNPKVRAKKP
jgi:hypothetical protein